MAAGEKKPNLNGRNSKGQMQPGHTLSRGKRKSATHETSRILKAALLSAISPSDICDIAKGLVKKAKAGDVGAAREVIDRAIGKAEETITGDITIVIRKH